MNTWSLTGEILNVGVKGKQYPKLWIQVSISSPHNSTIQDNKLFITFDSNQDPNSNIGRLAANIQHSYKERPFFLLTDATMSKIQHSKKNDKGEWENYELPGLKGKLSNLIIANTRFSPLNIGLIKGKVSSHLVELESTMSKFVVEESYRTPNDNKWKTRPIPILGETTESLTNKIVFVTASLCGITPSRESKTYGWANKIMVLS